MYPSQPEYYGILVNLSELVLDYRLVTVRPGSVDVDLEAEVEKGTQWWIDRCAAVLKTSYARTPKTVTIRWRVQEGPRWGDGNWIVWRTDVIQV